MGSMYGMGFDMFESMFGIVFVFIIGVFVFLIIKGIGEWNSNNHSPRLEVEAKAVGKRTSVIHHHTDDHMMHTSTTYYVTFQVNSGDRMEFHVSGSEYGQIAEGDIGMLTFQGTRYLGFERNML